MSTSTTTEKKTVASIVVLVCINVMDSVMGAIVGPTLIFYVNDLGGSKNDYGTMLSISSLSSMILIPIYGSWVDSNGNKYTLPYLSSFFLGIVSATLYFGAVLLPKGSIAIYALLISRFLAGMSMAGRTLSYSWVASAIDPKKQRNVFTFLSTSRTLGMIVGPLANMLVSGIDTEITIFGSKIPVDPNNSVGLFMLVGEVLLIVLTLLFLHEPPEKESATSTKQGELGGAEKTEAKGVWYALGYFDIFFPVFVMFAAVCNFMLIFTTLSPVARNMGWNPVQISEVTSVGATAMAIGMVISMVISMKDISDVTMIAFGLACFFLSGVSICTWWTDGVGYWHFVIPVYLMMFGYPFFGPANRSRYTKAIQGKKELEGSHGIMMSLITQAAAIATFIAPGTIAHFILRTQEEVDTSSNKHALTTGSLYVPILSVIMYLGLLYNHYFIDLPTERRSMDGSDAAISETTTLLPPKQKRESRAPRTSIIDISDAFSVSSRTSRRLSVEIMGVPNPVDTKYEMELDEQLLVDKELWDELEAMDEMEN